MRLDEVSGIRGLKQIYKSLHARKIEAWKRDEVFERHSAHFLTRCFPDWLK